MVLPVVRCTGSKIFHIRIRMRTALRRTTSKEVSSKIGTWNVRILRRAGRLEVWLECGRNGDAFFLVYESYLTLQITALLEYSF
jgi:hypothetical protein